MEFLHAMFYAIIYKNNGKMVSVEVEEWLSSILRYSII